MQFHLTTATLTTIVVPDISVKTTDVLMLAEHTILVPTTKTVSTKDAKIHAVSSTRADQDQLAIPMTTSQYVAANLDFSVIQKEAASLQVQHLVLSSMILYVSTCYFYKILLEQRNKHANIRQSEHKVLP